MSFLERLIDFNTKVNDFIWVKLGLILLLGTGMLMTLRTSGFQFRYISHWLKNTVGSLFNKKVSAHSHEKASISQFQALCTALAATVGVGNIAGVAAAIATGGPGAVFWMWIAALFCMMTSYSESVLGIYYRRQNKGRRMHRRRYVLSAGRSRRFKNAPASADMAFCISGCGRNVFF